MESNELTDDELRAEHKRARLLGNLAASAGEADAEAHFSSVQRAIENEVRVRNEGRMSNELLVL